MLHRLGFVMASLQIAFSGCGIPTARVNSLEPDARPGPSADGRGQVSGPAENPTSPGENPASPGDNQGSPGDEPGIPGDTPDSPDEPAPVAAEIGRPRYVVITDMTHDDDNSLIRLLHYANEIDIEAIIVTNQLPDYQASSPDPWNRAQQVLSAYEKVEGKLRQHDSKFPTAQTLRDVTRRGHGALHIAFVNAVERFQDWIGEGVNPAGLTKTSEGSEHLIKVFEKDDPRPIFVGMWGGALTLMQALDRFSQSHSQAQTQALLKKLHLYHIHIQDITADLVVDLNQLKSQACYRDRLGGFSGTRLVPASNLIDLGHYWEYIKAIPEGEVRGHGELSELYDGGGEGDTPSLLWLVSANRGLSDPRVPSHASWGGRFLVADGIANTHTACNSDHAEWTRWMTDARNDFKARLDWTMKSPADANHSPVVSMNGNSGSEILYVDVEPGKAVSLDASASKDPDGDSLTFRWWLDGPAGDISGGVNIAGSDSSKATVTLPDGQGVAHVVVEVRDNGSPALVGYRRVVLGRQATQRKP